MRRPTVAMLALALSCGPGTVSHSRGFSAPKPPNSVCAEFRLAAPDKALRMGLRTRPGEVASEVACDVDGSLTDYGVFVLDNIEPPAPFEARLVEAYPPVGPDQTWGATGPHTSGPAMLSGAAGYEHRQPHDSFTPYTLVMRYVRRENTLFAAWIVGKTSEMDVREADNAAWLDAVRFDDLTSPK